MFTLSALGLLALAACALGRDPANVEFTLKHYDAPGCKHRIEGDNYFQFRPETHMKDSKHTCVDYYDDEGFKAFKVELHYDREVIRQANCTVFTFADEGCRVFGRERHELSELDGVCIAVDPPVRSVSIECAPVDDGAVLPLEREVPELDSARSRLDGRAVYVTSKWMEGLGETSHVKELTGDKGLKDQSQKKTADAATMSVFAA